ncbi:heat shock protein 70 [Piromyces finnis]|uniref:Heat shock protein 70 n=1 Tax=Piromyces finnis TaxID=1754191 RepID=A0A1Y1UXY2_9FUNG|nr:heat shock protein 70 [Piromyces finnis]|eukprot:ORX43220.1 heat shock protein 70 [Piromyces finnis]
MVIGPVIGIDLGTNYSRVGIWEKNHVEIIPNELGKRQTRNCVSFTDFERLVGDNAISQLIKNYENTIINSKRLIGRDYNDKEVRSYQKNFPLKLGNKQNKPYISVKYKNQTREFLIEEIMSMTISKMKEIAEKHLCQPVKNAVITVPAYFNDVQRQAIISASKIACLDDIQLINEPTAAALSYIINNDIKNEENVLIVDIGSGTFDVSIINIKNNNITVKASKGDSCLGGEDFNTRLVDHFVKEFKEKYNKDLTTKPKSLYRLRKECEKIKLELTSFKEAFIDIDYLYNDIDFSSSITRSHFEKLSSDLFEKIMKSIKMVIKDAEFNKSDINEIILVGGTTRIPKIQKMITSYFNGKNINKTVNVEEAVANGAIIRASILSGKIKNIIVKDVLTHSLKIETKFINDDKIRDISFKCNSVIPIQKIIKYTISNNGKSTFNIYEDNNLLEGSNILYEYDLFKNTPPSNMWRKLKELFKKKDKEIINFNIDKNGILNISIEYDNIKYDKNKNIIIIENKKRVLHENEIQYIIKNSEKFKEDEKQENERRNCMNCLEKYASDLQKYVKSENNDYSCKVLNEAINYTIEWIKDNQNASKEEYKEKQYHLKQLYDNSIKKL